MPRLIPATSDIDPEPAPRRPADLVPVVAAILTEARGYSDASDRATASAVIDGVAEGFRDLPTVFELLRDIEPGFRLKWLEDQYMRLYLRVGPWFDPCDRARFGLKKDVLQLATFELREGAQHLGLLDRLLDVAEKKASRLELSIGVEAARPGFARVLRPRGYTRLDLPEAAVTRRGCWLKLQP